MSYSSLIFILEPMAIVAMPMFFTALVIWWLIPVKKKRRGLPKRLILENSRLNKF
jgi:cbb3-type cytochrome oxidase subunit 3